MSADGATAWPHLPEADRVARLAPPAGRVPVVLDTDAANEIDDQWAIAYAVLSPERIDLRAVHAAPFGRDGVPPAEGMARSAAEVRRVLAALGGAAGGVPVVEGSRAWLPGAGRPVPSAAADDLVARARRQPDGEPLHVVALGAPTNVASALLTAPDLVGRIVVVWLGGNGTWWHPAANYNLEQDVRASRVLLDSGVPLVHVPCLQVTEALQVTGAEVQARLAGSSRIGDLLAADFAAFNHWHPRRKELWDLGPVAWLAHPEWTTSALLPAPRLAGERPEDLAWAHDPTRHLLREVRSVAADAVLDDVLDRLAGA